MDLNHISTSGAYTGLAVVSPMMFGDEKKDQDRARWSEPGQIACVCDGVSSSPNAAEAATLVTSFIPSVSNGNIHDRLSMLCDQLMACRQECQQNSIILPDGTPHAMADMLCKVVHKKRAISYQTTVIAAQFICDKKGVSVQVLKCGDSASFAFSPEGQLLTSSLALPSDLQHRKESLGTKRMTFGPDDEMLVKVEGLLSRYRSLARQAGIKLEHLRNWLVCAPVDICHAGNQNHYENLLELRALALKPSDRLLVPRYLYGTQLTSQGQRYRVIRYSSTIRPVFSTETPASINSFNEHSSTTMVLPDHFYCGCYDSFQDQFPPETSFILCSDGFYGSFSDWEQLWAWLQENAAGLNNNAQREEILCQLHSDLHSRGGDDDISFVWVHPANSQSVEPANVRSRRRTKGGNTLCQRKS